MPSLLVVDDSATDLRRIVGLLSRNKDYSITTAADGLLALQSLEGGVVDAVLTDLQMPEMDGLQLVQEMRVRFPLIPVVVMTGKGSEEIAVQAIKSGATAYVNKSVAGHRLQDMVQRVLVGAVRSSAHNAILQKVTSDRYELSLENDRTLMSTTSRFLAHIAGASGVCSEAEVVRITMAFEEALLNACLHGNLDLDSELRERDDNQFNELAQRRAGMSPWQDRRVRVVAAITPESMSVEITDEGAGFSLDDLPDPTLPENLLKPHGRGVVMMKMLMDEVLWNDRGNQVTLVKNGSLS